MYINYPPALSAQAVNRYTWVSLFKICQIILSVYNQNVDKSHFRANYSLMEYFVTFRYLINNIKWRCLCQHHFHDYISSMFNITSRSDNMFLPREQSPLLPDCRLQSLTPSPNSSENQKWLQSDIQLWTDWSNLPIYQKYVHPLCKASSAVPCLAVCYFPTDQKIRRRPRR